MPPPDLTARPRQVTFAGWGVAIASVMLVLAVFDTIGQLESVDMRERLAAAVSTGSLKDFGLTVSEALDIIRWCLYVSGVAAAVSGVFGVFVLQGHRGARIGLTVAAVAIVLTGSVAGSFPGFLAMLIGFGAAVLWTRPARDWFAGRPISVRAPSSRPEPPAAPPTQPLPWAPPDPGSTQPPPTVGWGQAPTSGPPPDSATWPAPTTPPVATGTPPDEVVADRPAQVRLACILTAVFSAITGLGYLAVLVMLAVDSTALVNRLKENPNWDDSFDEDTVTTLATVAGVGFLVWSVAALVLAVLVWRRVRWAWVLLMVSILMAGLLSILAFPYSLAHMAAVGVSGGLLMRRSTRDWFAAAPSSRQPSLPGPKPPVW